MVSFLPEYSRLTVLRTGAVVAVVWGAGADALLGISATSAWCRSAASWVVFEVCPLWSLILKSGDGRRPGWRDRNEVGDLTTLSQTMEFEKRFGTCRRGLRSRKLCQWQLKPRPGTQAKMQPGVQAEKEVRSGKTSDTQHASSKRADEQRQRYSTALQLGLQSATNWQFGES